MATDTSKGLVKFFDDFLGDTINLDHYVTNSDTGGTAFAVNVQHNGVIRGSVDTDDNDITNIFSENQWRADDGGPLTLEVRAKAVTSLADGETYIGFTDDNATDENPITLSTTDVQTSNASDAAGFAYTGAGTADWKAVAVRADNDATPVRCNVGGATTPAVGTWQTFKIVVDEDGNARYYINGIEHATINSAVTATTLMGFGAAVQSGGTARSLDIDYIEIIGGRRTTA